MKPKVVLEPPSMKNVIWNKPLEKKEGDISNKDYSDGNEEKEPLQKKPEVFNPLLMRQLIQMEPKVVLRPPLMKNVIWKKPLEKKEGDISDEDYSDDDEEEELLQMKSKVVLNSPLMKNVIWKKPLEKKQGGISDEDYSDDDEEEEKVEASKSSRKDGDTSTMLIAVPFSKVASPEHEAEAAMNDIEAAQSSSQMDEALSLASALSTLQDDCCPGSEGYRRGCKDIRHDHDSGVGRQASASSNRESSKDVLQSALPSCLQMALRLRLWQTFFTYGTVDTTTVGAAAKKMRKWLFK
ncbi:hypothetical protein BT93_C0992 [Corymbia citriodora subsp. variegata]|nr:hypothetical protein BT93_C0992 [Corymbia citriodora subsp. variegata]